MWQRPSGPPHIWKVIELTDADGKKRKFSIQEIPEDRYDEVVQHMCTHFIRDSSLCAKLNVKDEEESITEFRNMWEKILKQGIAVAAFEMVDNDKLTLAGTNMLFGGNSGTDELFENIRAKTSRAAEIVKFAMANCAHIDPRKLYNVEHYLGALGLSVDPKYRGLGLGKHLLQARDNIGKAYGIEYTTTLFSNLAAQKSAANAGLKVGHECDFHGIKCKIMGKRLC